MRISKGISPYVSAIILTLITLAAGAAILIYAWNLWQQRYGGVPTREELALYETLSISYCRLANVTAGTTLLNAVGVNCTAADDPSVNRTVIVFVVENPSTMPIQLKSLYIDGASIDIYNHAICFATSTDIVSNGTTVIINSKPITSLTAIAVPPGDAVTITIIFYQPYGRSVVNLKLVYGQSLNEINRLCSPIPLYP